MNENSSPSEMELLNAITGALSRYITEDDPCVLFSGLLETLLELTTSEYGFIGEISHGDDGAPYIKNYATTNIAWDNSTRELYQALKNRGMIFSRLDSLYGAVVMTGQAVITNNPQCDPRSSGLPKGHPPLNSFMGLPFFRNDELLGIVGLANRPAGYQPMLASRLSPFLVTCSNLIQAYRHHKKHQQVAAELERYRERIGQVDKLIVLGNGYEFSPNQPAISKQGQLIMLTKKELALLAILVEKRNQVVPYQKLDSIIWGNTIVGESSLRSLVKKLRKKLPELDIKTVSGIGYILSLDFS
jgi:GAF domain-containing protein